MKKILTTIGKICEQWKKPKNIRYGNLCEFYQDDSKEGREKAKTDPVSKWLTLVLNQIFPG